MSNGLEAKAAKRKFRRHIFEQWHLKCAYCERRAEDIDHVISKYNGGGNRLTNLVPSCVRCNQSKGSEDVLVWWKKQYYYDEDRYNQLQFWIENGFVPINHSGD